MFGLSAVDLLTGLFPAMSFALIALSPEMKGSAGKHTFLYCLFMAGFAVHPAIEWTSGRPAIESTGILLKVACGFCAYHLSYRLFTFRDRARIIRSLSIAVTVTLIMSIGQLATGIGLEAHEKAYIQGVYHDPGMYSRMALLGFALSLPFVSLGKFARPNGASAAGFVFWPMLLFSMMTMAYSISRNVIICAAAVAVMFAIIRRAPIVLVTVVAFGAMLWLVAPVVRSTMAEKWSTELALLDGVPSVTVEQVGSGRIGVWMEAYEEFKDGSTWQRLIGRGEGIGPHGQWIGILLRNGVIGALIAFIFYTRVWLHSLRIALKNREQRDSIIPLLVATSIMVLSLASSPFYTFILQMVLFSLLAIWEQKAPRVYVPRPLPARAAQGPPSQWDNHRVRREPRRR